LFQDLHIEHFLYIKQYFRVESKRLVQISNPNKVSQ